MNRLPAMARAGAPLLTLMLAGYMPAHRTTPTVTANDNRHPAGSRHGDTLILHLAVGMATWSPEAASGPSITVAAFSEAGQLPAIPAPLIRVRSGTFIVATVRNDLTDSTIAIHGLVTHPSATDDSILLKPGDSATVRFAAGAPGTYLYTAVMGRHNYSLFNTNEREQLGGAFIVDPPQGSPPDRVLVINIWSQKLDAINSRNALTINGRSWPFDERIGATVGDSVRWRVVNASNRGHPMHLHGFYFQIGSRGGRLGGTEYAPGDRPEVVTESMTPFNTMAMTFVPDRPGDWLFHCHIGYHVVPEAARLGVVGPDHHDRMSDDPRMHMAGLVVGIAVRPDSSWQAPARVQPLRLRLFVDEGTPHGVAPRALGYVLQRGNVAPRADSVEIPGSPLILRRGQPTDVVVINRLHETAAVHWHGLELESWSDGVSGWSGMDSTHTAMSVQPADSFVAHLTLRRAGTFIYHTHMNDLEQLTSGLYGAIVVLEPGQRYDPATDHLFIVGWDGPITDPRPLVINGTTTGPTVTWRAGTAHRLRFINIGPAVRVRFALDRGGQGVPWLPLAKDGADLPPSQRTLRPTGGRWST